MKRSIGIFLLALAFFSTLFLALFSPTPHTAQAEEVGDQSAQQLLRSLAKESSTLTSLYTHFRQVKTMQLLVRPLTSEGFLCVRKTNTASVSLLWAYTHPIATGFLYQNGQAKLWEGHLAEMRAASSREEPLLASLAEHILDLVNIREERILKAYQVERPGPMEACLILTPRKKSFFSRLTLHFSDDLKRLSRLKFTEKNGDSLSIDFQGTLHNTSLPAPCAPLLK